MENFMSSRLWTGALLILLTFSACQRDEVDLLVEPPQTQRLIVSAADIPQVTSTLLEKMGVRNSLSNFSVRDEGASLPFSINWERIKKLVDSTGSETYAFGLSVNDGDPATFYNLVLRYNADKQARQPFIYKYTMAEDFLPQYLATGSLEGFQGSVKKIKVNAAPSFRNRSSANDSGSAHEVLDGEECPHESTVGGSSGGSNPGSNGGGNGNTGSGGDPQYPGGDDAFECIYYVEETDWYQCLDPNCQERVFDYTSYDFTTECGWQSSSSAAGADDACGPEEGSTPIVEPLDLDHLILFDPSFENTKAECVYNKLNDTSHGFQNMIRKFDGDFPVAHLRFAVDNTLPQGTGAKTVPPIDYTIEIRVNGQTMNSRTNLELARNLIHEVIHAEIWRKVMSVLDNGGDLYGMTRDEWLNKLSQGDYPGIYDFYSRHGIGKFQHEQMGAFYVNTIANTLKGFDNGQNSDELYQSLAWVGLMNTEAWRELSITQKATIIANTSYHSQNGIKTCQ